MRKPWKNWNLLQVSIALVCAIALNSFLLSVGSNEQLPGFVSAVALLLIPIVIGTGIYVGFSHAAEVDKRKREADSVTPAVLRPLPKHLRTALLTIGLVLECGLFFLLVRDALRGSWLTSVIYAVTIIICAAGIATAKGLGDSRTNGDS